MSTKTAKMDLIGIDEICDFTWREPATVLEWKNTFGFPMERQGGVWCANAEGVINWLAERGCTRRTATTKALELYLYKENRNSGGLRFNRVIEGLERISDFVGLSWGTVHDWYKNFMGCPIAKNQAGQLAVDADELVGWIVEHKLPHKIAGVPLAEGQF